MVDDVMTSSDMATEGVSMEKSVIAAEAPVGG
jgi:hypothetical protein